MKPSSLGWARSIEKLKSEGLTLISFIAPLATLARSFDDVQAVFAVPTLRIHAGSGHPFETGHRRVGLPMAPSAPLPPPSATQRQGSKRTPKPWVAPGTFSPQYLRHVRKAVRDRQARSALSAKAKVGLQIARDQETKPRMDEHKSGHPHHSVYRARYRASLSLWFPSVSHCSSGTYHNKPLTLSYRSL